MDQQHIIEEYDGLIKSWIYQFIAPFRDFVLKRVSHEDLIQEGRMILLDVSRYVDPSDKSSFLPYLKASLQRRLGYFLYKHLLLFKANFPELYSKSSINAVLSLCAAFRDTVVFESELEQKDPSDPDYYVPLEAYKPVHDNYDDKIFFKEVMEYVRSHTTPRNFAIFQLYIAGATMEEIALSYGITRSRVQQIICNICKKVRRYVARTKNS